MLLGQKSRDDLNKHATDVFMRSETVNKVKLRRQFYDDLYDKFNLPVSIAEEMITFKKDIKEFSTIEVFWVMWFLDRKCLSKYFTETEIDVFSKDKYEEDKIEFPIVFDNICKIADDQYIGSISAQMLMKLKNARLINYDENEQRALKKVKSGSVEIYKPYVNEKSVKEIKKAMEDGIYIPDPMTLNMPFGSEFEFKDHKLIVYSLPQGMFNLDDGYHRYLAISQIYDFDKSFDYTMILQIVNFDNTKANTFIFQLDQKTQMKKIISDTYDPNAIPNKIMSRINHDPTCNIQGMIGRNRYNINSASLGKLISYYYPSKNIRREDEAKFVIQTSKTLVNKFNVLTTQDDTFLGKYSDAMLFTTMFVFNSNLPEEQYSKFVVSALSELTDEEKRIMSVSTLGVVRKKGENILQDKLKKWR